MTVVEHQVFIRNSYGIEHLLCWTSVQFSMILYAAFVVYWNSHGFCCIIIIIIIIITLIIIIIILIIIIMLCLRSASVPGNK
jgi:hypothetical protein